MQETHLPRMGYVQNDDGTPLRYTVGIVQTQGSSLREQPWALRHNSAGVGDIDHKDQYQISSYQALRTGEDAGLAVAAPLMKIDFYLQNASQRCPRGRGQLLVGGTPH